MPDAALLAVFIPTFFFVSITPGMCMTLAMTLGMSIGVRRTLWMMLGELTGVAIVAIAAVLGVASIMLNYPQVFEILKYAGGAYLAYIGINMWRAKGKMAIVDPKLASVNQVDSNQIQAKAPVKVSTKVPRATLISQGFITAIANPKGWAFMISLLPPFISVDKAIAPQLAVLLGIIMLTESVSMLAYATGGKSLRLFLTRGDNIRWLNRIAGSLMIAVGIWLALG
ncbi:Lysine exporter protein (LYSE/YGGA) [Shewanella denitrificans OS217]|uniref:Lysine exporter protein (LYSE/YGGA) n=1 Tax=Shewanella denitrificans (strain OS217 / ATCC BAA-1090 / DSM 15013) TaxID=318161 RepID=Q12M80_SHEDO|nr:LysE family translocator [Shewanella denitrificans]ABE55446.1 Lysine exporter protein (LYSE/YGGA) [Shewanella denitrificans OS217]